MFALSAQRVSLMITGTLLLKAALAFGNSYPGHRIGVSALYNPVCHFGRSFPLTLLPNYTLSLNKQLGLGTGLTMLETGKTGPETIQTEVREFLMPVTMLWSLGRNKSKYETGVGMALTYQTNLSTDMENQTYPSRRMAVYPNLLLSGYRWRPSDPGISFGVQLWLMIDYDFFPPVPFRPYLTVDIGYQL